jgi:hypothetical protein
MPVTKDFSQKTRFRLSLNAFDITMSLLVNKAPIGNKFLVPWFFWFS